MPKYLAGSSKETQRINKTNAVSNRCLISPMKSKDGSVTTTEDAPLFAAKYENNGTM
jgi:hypothetical protein